MIPVPAYLVDAVARHHRPRWQVVGGSGPWPVTNGRITLSRSSLPNILVEADIIQLTGNPSAVDIEFQPFGSTATVTWGVDPWPDTLTIGDGLPVVVTSVTRPESIVKVKLQDPAAIIAKHTLPPGEAITPPTTVLDAVTTLVRRTYPLHTISDPSGLAAATPVPDDWRQTDPWQGVSRAAQAAGLTAVYTSGSVVTLYEEPATTGPVVDSVTVLDHIIDYTITYERAYSRVVLEYENVTGTWDAATGPLVGLPPSTYYEKRDGTTVQSYADAQAAAWGDRAAGRVASLEFTCVPRPWLQPGDRIEVVLLNGTTSQAIIDQITLPMDGSPMRVTVRNSDYISPAEY